MSHGSQVFGELKPTSQAEKLWSDLSLWDIRSCWKVVIPRTWTLFAWRRAGYAGKRERFLIESYRVVRVHFKEENVVYIVLMCLMQEASTDVVRTCLLEKCLAFPLPESWSEDDSEFLCHSSSRNSIGYHIAGARYILQRPSHVAKGVI